MTLDFFEKFQENVRRLPDRVALQIVSGGNRESYTFKRIESEVGKISRFLTESGVGSGDTVGILMENHPRWGIAFLAAQSSGARIVPFDILHTSETLAGLVSHAECRFLIASQATLAKLEEIQALLPRRLPGLVAAPAASGYALWNQALKDVEQPEGLPLSPADLDATFLIVYTSGTTGNPKGVMLTRRQIYRTTIEVLHAVQATPRDHILGVLPLYHMLALMCNFFIPLYLGARVTYLDALDPPRILKSFRDEGITLFVCVPQFFYLLHRRIFQEIEKQGTLKRFLFKRLLRVSHFCNRRLRFNPGRLLFRPIHKNFGTLRLFGVGGARFDVEVADALTDLGFNMAQAYGMTETSAVSTVAPGGVDGLGSVGRPLRHVKLKIAEPDENGVGEVLIAGDHIMQGYWKNAEATAEALEDGWLHTGDLGRLDPEGFLHITGRKKDVIVLSSGKNIYPEEIEHAYEKRCPFIKEMCVLGVPDTSSSEAEEKLHAVIVPDFDYLKSQQVVNAADMIRYMLETISQQLPAYKRVRSFEIRREPLPRTTTRKIKRFEVQKEVESRGVGAEAPKFAEESQPQSPVEEKVFDLIRRTGKVAAVNREMSLELDCGFDSLSRVEFMTNVQDVFRLHISDEAATQIFTVQDVVEAVEKRLSGEIQDEEESGSKSASWSEILNRPLQEEEERHLHRILRRRPLVELFYYFLTCVLWLLCKVFYRLKVEGRENLPDRYPFMICPNHLSFLDGFVFSAGMPLRIVRRLFYLGYSDYFGTPTMSYLGSLIKVVPVDADRHLRQALRLGAQGLRDDLVLCVFPEGERSIDGSLKVFRKGPAILATELKVPVVPVAIRGTYEAWSRGSSKFRFHPVTLRIGEPIVAGEGESHDAFNERLFEAVRKLFERGAPRR